MQECMASPYTGPQTQVSDVSGRTFDYVIVGGGTAGLALASRLSSDHTVTVAVLEAGESHIGDPNITTSATNDVVFGNPKYDWDFETAPQQFIKGRQIKWTRGKGIGGSSAINWQVWITPHKDDIDALEKLGNPGWNWNEYEKYFKRVQAFHPASEEALKAYTQTHDHQESNPIQTRVPRHSVILDSLFSDTLENIGIKVANAPYSGDNYGTRIAHSSVEQRTWHRSYSANGYYWPVRERKNLVVLTEALVSRVIFGDSTAENGDLIATGVEFLHAGEKHIVECNREVILSAGAIKSPQILELSGIGRPDILKKIGVDVKLDLPGVGENVQEHALTIVKLELDARKVQEEPFILFFDPSNAMRIVKEPTTTQDMPNMALAGISYFPLSAVLPDSAPAFIKSTEEEIEKLKRSGTLPPGLAEQYDLQLEHLRDPSVPDCQLLNVPGRIFPFPNQTPDQSFMSILLINNHPFSRGTIHAISADPTENPELDPRYHEVNADLKLLTQHLAVTKKMLEHEPLRSRVLHEYFPDPSVITEEQIEDYVRDTTASTWHTIGSCSMLPRDKQGVVSPELIVYGTKNVRVVDISIVPLHFSAHTQATVYVIAEKAADLIRGR